MKIFSQVNIPLLDIFSYRCRTNLGARVHFTLSDLNSCSRFYTNGFCRWQDLLFVPSKLSQVPFIDKGMKS